MSFRTTLFITYLLVILVAVATLGFYLGRELDQHYLDTLQASLTTQAGLIRDLAEAEFTKAAPAATLNPLARRLGQEAHLRVTFIAPDGRVLGDSESDYRTMENHAHRPEVRQALATGRGQAIHPSHTLGVDMLYVALPARQNGQTVGVVRLALPLYQVAAAQRRGRAMVTTAALIALAFALLLSIFLAYHVTRTVRKLDRAARRLAEGDLNTRVRLRGTRELTTLAAAFNEMAERLRTMVQELHEEQQKVATILENLGEAVLVADNAGQITLCNLKAEQLFGLAREQALGLSVVDATQSLALDEALRHALATGQTQQTEVQLQFPERRILEATVTTLAVDETHGAIAVLHDVTDLRRLEGVRREFVTNASHELQTPVTAIRAMAETLLAGGEDDPALAARYLGELERQAARLGTLVKDLFDLSTIESGALPLEFTEINVAQAAQAAFSGLQALAVQRQITVTIAVPDELVVRADATALQRVLANLLDNAIKYTPPGGAVRIEAQPCDGQVAIAVQDSGIGIPSTDLPRVFERFYRVDKARSRELGGTGLGLSIVKHLVEAMGGEVTADSTLGHGSRFTITLPTPGE